MAAPLSTGLGVADTSTTPQTPPSPPVTTRSSFLDPAPPPLQLPFGSFCRSQSETHCAPGPCGFDDDGSATDACGLNLGGPRTGFRAPPPPAPSSPQICDKLWGFPGPNQEGLQDGASTALPLYNDVHMAATLMHPLAIHEGGARCGSEHRGISAAVHTPTGEALDKTAEFAQLAARAQQHGMPLCSRSGGGGGSAFNSVLDPNTRSKRRVVRMGRGAVTMLFVSGGGGSPF